MGGRGALAGEAWQLWKSTELALLAPGCALCVRQRACSTPPPPPHLPAVAHMTYTTYPNKMHGHYGFPPYLKGRRPCAPATCNSPADWAHHLAEVGGARGGGSDMKLG